MLSLGAGLQSSAMLLMAIAGEVERPDHAIFADTGWEPAATYRHLEWLEREAAAAGLPLHRVSAGDLRSAALDPSTRNLISVPAFVRGPGGQKGILRRQCTSAFKITPIRRKVRELLGHNRLRPGIVELWLGISTDEAPQEQRAPGDDHDRVIEHERDRVRHHAPRASRRSYAAHPFALLAEQVPLLGGAVQGLNTMRLRRRVEELERAWRMFWRDGVVTTADAVTDADAERARGRWAQSDLLPPTPLDSPDEVSRKAAAQLVPHWAAAVAGLVGRLRRAGAAASFAERRS